MATEEYSSTKSPFDEFCDSMEDDGFAEEAPGSTGGIPDPEECGPVYREWEYNAVTGGTVTVHRKDTPAGKQIWRSGKAENPFHPLDGFDAGKPIVVCEGEPACDALRKAEINATTGIGGARLWKTTDWRCLANGVHVTLWPDRDAPGEDAMRQLGRILVAQGCRVAVVDVADLEEKADAADLDAGEIRKRLDDPELIDFGDWDEAEEEEAEDADPVTFAEWLAAPRETDYWLIERLVHKVGMFAIYGREKIGKSGLLANMVHAILTGASFAGREVKLESARVAWFSFEEEGDEIADRQQMIGTPNNAALEIFRVYERDDCLE
ncbi:MAG: AAA family ATPase [Gammaproteobacteria bacterium]|nr:AAA family ATPase [Gammaproteobacteria bacterium]